MVQLKIDLQKDGNIFAIIGIVARKLQDVSGRPARNEFTTGAMKCSCYDEVLEYAKKLCLTYQVELTFINIPQKDGNQTV